ncbi:MAG: S-layer homology domain-containing protein [Oscillospiraceae bacterium]|nr:S-layer homology domain-containing protein [Oscillospiraceae bacterium]
MTLAFVMLFSLIPMATADENPPMEPVVVPVPLAADPVSTWAELNAAILGAGGGTVTIELTTSFSAGVNEDAIRIEDGSNIFLTSAAGGPFTFTQTNAGQRHFILSTGTLTLTNVILSGDRENPAITWDHGGISLGTGPTGIAGGPTVRRLYVEAGGVIQNNRSSQGGGVFLNGGNAALILDDGGTISGNLSTGPGGGVSVTGSSTFTMDGGIIEANVATTSGGGVQVVGSQFILAGGTIYNNAANNGAGMFLQGASSVLMSGGSVERNEAASHGGGAMVNAGVTFTMTGGDIYDNDAGSDGGGVVVLNGNFVLQDGTIENNRAANGGGVFVWGTGTVTMNDGTITRNIAQNNGGGVHITGEGSLFTMNGGEIVENLAGFILQLPPLPPIPVLNPNHGGGGVNIHSGTFTLNNGTILENLSGSHGGGVRRGGGPAQADQNAFFNMLGGALSDNTAALDGGGLFAAGGVYNTDTLPPDAYPRITIGANAVFSGNRARAAFRPPSDISAIAYRIQTTSATLFGSPFNNFDINFNMPPEVHYLTVRFETNLTYGSFNAPGPTNEREENIYITTPSPPGIPAGSPLHPQGRPEVTAVSGQTFTGWLVDGTLSPLLSNAQVDAFDITDDTTFIAQYAGYVNHIVRFYRNYGANPFYMQKTAQDGQPVPVPAPPMRSGFNFQGWYTTPATTTPYNFATPVTGNLNLYARWTFAGGGNGGGGNGGGGGGTTDLPSRQAYLIGTEEGLIRPHANITRAEVATIFFRLITDADRAANWSQTNSFPDVELNHWFNNAVSTTTRMGIFQGRPDGTFGPNDPITRAELATAVTRFMDVAGLANTGNNLFSDIQGHWANVYINAAAMNSWVQGPDGLGGAFYPDRPITRAETAAIINRIFQRLPETTADLLPNMVTWPDNANTNAWFYLYLQSASNSYTFRMKADGIHESWVTLVPVRDWAVLERPNSRPEHILR